MTYIVSGGALNSTHSFTPFVSFTLTFNETQPQKSLAPSSINMNVMLLFNVHVVK